MPQGGFEHAGEISWGSHQCLFYRSQAELSKVTAAYICAGLLDRELCVWVTTAPLTPALAHEALRREGCDAAAYVRSGQLQVVPHDAWYLEEGRFDKAGVLGRWEALLRRVKADHYAGLRITGDPTWFCLEEDRRTFMDYEREANGLFANERVMALCTYATSGCSTDDMFEVMAAHRSVFVGSGRSWKAITISP